MRYTSAGLAVMFHVTPMPMNKGYRTRTENTHRVSI